MQSASSVETIYKTTAFRNVIFPAAPVQPQPLTPWHDAGIGLVTVRFTIKCAYPSPFPS